MKILVLAGNVYLPVSPFNKSKNGFGYTVGSFCQNFAIDHDVYLLTQSTFTHETMCKNIHIVKKTISDVLKNISLRYIKIWWKETKGIPLFSENKLRSLVYYLTGAYVEKIINDIQPDIVNIRGIHFTTSSFLHACKNLKIPYVVSLHGLNSFNKELNSSNDLILLEKKYLLSIHDNPVTVISTGIKKRIENFLGKEMTNIKVVLNGIEEIYHGDYVDEDLMKELDIPRDSNVLISVSSVNKNKNQVQVLDALHLLPESVRKKTYYLICGVGDYEETIRKRAEELRIQNNVKLCGYIKNTEIWRYYSISNVNMMVSHSEGFGRSVIEGYMCGIPAVMYSNLDACEDITDAKTAIVVENRSDKALMQGILKALSIQWNSDEIKAYSQKFSDKEMTKNYINYFESIIHNNIKV